MGWKCLKKLKIELPYDPSIILLGTHLGKNKNINSKSCINLNIHSSTIENDQDIKAIQMSMNWQMDKDMACMSSGILHNHSKSNILSFAEMWMGLENFILNEVGQRKTKTVWHHLYVESKNNRNVYAKKNRLTCI